MQKSTLDWGKPGTARYRRKCQLKGLSQAALGHACKPEVSQTAIGKFESGEVALTHAMARRLAPGYFPELWRAGNRAEAEKSIWKIWFATVESGNDSRMKGLVEEIQANWAEYDWEAPATGLFAGVQQGPLEPATERRATCQQ